MRFYATIQIKKGGENTLRVYTVKESAEILKVHPRTITRKINDGKLKAKNIGSDLKPDYRIKEEWLEDYLNNDK